MAKNLISYFVKIIKGKSEDIAKLPKNKGEEVFYYKEDGDSGLYLGDVKLASGADYENIVNANDSYRNGYNEGYNAGFEKGTENEYEKISNTMLQYTDDEKETLDNLLAGLTNQGSAAFLFYKRDKITDFPAVNTKDCNSFEYTFGNCTAATELPTINTSKGTNFECMYRNANKAEKIGDLDTKNGNLFNSMFRLCSSLKKAPKIDTENGTEFKNMFDSCTKLEEIPALNLTNAKDYETSDLFAGCSNLKEIGFEGKIRANGLDLSPCPLLSKESLTKALNCLDPNAIRKKIHWYNLNTNEPRLSRGISNVPEINTLDGTETFYIKIEAPNGIPSGSRLEVRFVGKTNPTQNYRYNVLNDSRYKEGDYLYEIPLSKFASTATAPTWGDFSNFQILASKMSQETEFYISEAYIKKGYSVIELIDFQKGNFDAALRYGSNNDKIEDIPIPKTITLGNANLKKFSKDEINAIKMETNWEIV